MNSFNRILELIFFLLFTSFLNIDACRFTVREIGFSVLSQDLYTLAVIDRNADPHDKLWNEFHNKNRDCNIRLEVQNPLTDSEHPIVINAKQKGLKFPATILVAPNNRIFQFSETDISKVYSSILDSPLSSQIRKILPDVFSIVFWVKGKDKEKNQKVSQQVVKDCELIENVMPGMPKVVKDGPVEIAVSENNILDEKLLLWSLGIDEMLNEPCAFVLYGRGRIIGDVLDYKQIMKGGLYRFMSMIGADCECGLDKKWMLGNQIPLLWNKKSRQSLTELIGFDVDNPMILAEMSRILAKESLSDKTGSIAFAPETINLDEVFGNSLNTSVGKEPESKTDKTLIYTFLLMVIAILVIVAILLFK